MQLRAEADDRSRGLAMIVAGISIAALLIVAPSTDFEALELPGIPGAGSESVVAERVGDSVAGAPLAFVRNEGQLDRRVRYYIQGSQASLYFTDRGVRMSLSGAGMSDPVDNPGDARWVIDHAFLHAGTVTPIATQRSEMTVSYFKGDRADWNTGLPTFERIVYRDVWRGIDVAYYGTGAGLEYDLVVHPGADPDDIRLAWQSATTVRATASGALEIGTPIGSFLDEAPYAYQRTSGRRVEVPARFDLGPNSYRFELNRYDEARTLVIDPVVLVYAGYLGGSGAEEGNGIAVDSSGSAYVTGFTNSTQTTFPETVGPDLTHNGANTFDAFVAKVMPDGSAFTYAGYIGGTGNDFGRGIAVDSSGAAYITGSTNSTEASFPDAGGPGLSYNGGTNDAFVAKVNAAGTGLIYAGYIGGNESDGGRGIAVDGSGAYVTGFTDSDEGSFPLGGALDFSHNGGADAFVAKVSGDGTFLQYSGYIGGSGDDRGLAIAIDGGAAYVTGYTESSAATFPEKVGPDLTYNGDGDAFVAKVTSDGNSLVYAGYIGGSGVDEGEGIAVDGSGIAHATGYTESTQATFPEKVGPDLTYNGGQSDALVAKVTSDGSALSNAGYIGGSGLDYTLGIALDSSGAAHVTGYTNSTQATFPATGGPDSTYNGGDFDAFVAKVNKSGTSLGYAGYIGGDDNEGGIGIAYRSGAAYVFGHTASTEATFPDKGGPDLSHSGSGNDAFLAKVAPCTIRGTNAGETLTGTSGEDVICGLGGNDVLKGLGGNDRVVGGTGNDKLFGGPGKDVLLGGPGNDRLSGGPGKDRCKQGPGSGPKASCES